MRLDLSFAPQRLRARSARVHCSAGGFVDRTDLGGREGSRVTGAAAMRPRSSAVQ